jgi:DMSO/TMAO reductase YedYZ molybdopterin-dependent catalytic subunit
MNDRLSTRRISWTRRNLLAAAAAFGPLQAQETAAFKIAGKRPMILHNDFPEDLEALPEYLDTWVTPYHSFFVRQHLPRPKVDPASFRLEIGGMVGRKSVLSIADLGKLPQHTVPATLECAGNGRGNFRPRVPGLQWTKGAIGNAEWRGPRVKDVLAAAGASSSAAWISCNGADTGVARTPDFIRSIPMRKAMHEATIIALEMNGAPTPELHGGPARLIVPGWDGASWVKWVTAIDAAAEPDNGFYMNPAYRQPMAPVAPGQAARPEDLVFIEGMAVKSFFAKPAQRARLSRAPVNLSGAAWAGENRVTSVQVSTDGGASWKPAKLSRQDFPFAWRTWTFEWSPPRSGFFTLCCRATDSAGRTQPIEAEWNPSGYLYNAIERLGVTVEG